MPNQFNVVDWISMKGLAILVNELTIAEYFNTAYNSEFTKEFAIGETVRVNLPPRLTIRSGAGYSPQALQRPQTTVTVDQQFGIDFEYDSIEKALRMEREDEAETYVRAAVAQIAQEIDSRAALWAYQNTNNVVGALGTNPTAMTTYTAARQRMVENACPMDRPRAMIITPAMHGSISNAVATVFNPQRVISRSFNSGKLGEGAGFDEWFESMSLYAHTAGTWAGAVTVNGAGQSGSSLTVTATAGDTFLKGDTISVANVNNVNPPTRQSTGAVKHFLITQSLTAAGGGADVLSISPAIVGPGDPNQNVDALPANSAALTLWPGTASPSGKSGKLGLAISKDAFAMVGVKLQEPKGSVEFCRQYRDKQTGIALRFLKQYVATEDKMVHRFDVLIGFGNLYADQCAVRVASST